MEAHFTSLPEAGRFLMADGVSGRPLFGQAAMLNLVELAPEAVLPSHSHPHEQLGVVLRGELTLVVAGQDHLLREMDAYALPGGLEHEGRAGAQGALVLDVFAPIREDYRSAAAGS